MATAIMDGTTMTRTAATALAPVLRGVPAAVNIWRSHSAVPGRHPSRSVAIAHLAVLKHELGDLKRVRRIVKVLGMVNSDPAFTQQPAVVNGYSDLMVAVFGERGKHARSAVGMATLPNGIPVEVEVIVEIDPVR